MAGDFYELAEAEQAERLARLAGAALGAFGLADGRLELIKIRENAVFAARLPDGRRCVVRVHRHGYHSDAALRSEWLWMRALDEAGIRTPAWRLTRGGEPFSHARVDGVPEPRQVDVQEWIEGESLGTIERGIQAPEAELIRVYETIGELAARLHEQAASWTRPAGFERHAWDVEGLVGEQPVWGRFWEGAFLSADERRAMQRVRERLRAELEAVGQGVDRYGLIHADFLPENLLVARDGIRLIDFDDSGHGWHLFDLATPLFVQLGQPRFEQVRQALVDGYRRVRPLPDEWLAHLPGFLVARGTTYLGWLQTRHETRTARGHDGGVVAAIVGLLRAWADGPG